MTSVAAVFQPVDVAALPTKPLVHNSARRAARLPADAVLDVLAIGLNYEPRIADECPHLVHASFDRAASHARGYDSSEESDYSLVRRTTGLTSDGRPILQHTRTGEFDFKRSVLTPGRYP